MWRIGLESGVRHGESPNGALKCGGMDFEATESKQKSKRSEEKWRIEL